MTEKSIKTNYQIITKPGKPCGCIHTHTHTSLLNENTFKNIYYDMEKNVKNILTGLHFYCKSICVAQNKKLKRKRWFRKIGSFNLNEPIWRIKKAKCQ